MKLGLLNTSILTATGTYKLIDITLESARDIIGKYDEPHLGIESAIGHAATAQIMSELLKYPVVENRIEFKQEVSQVCLVFKLNGRAEEGKIMTREEVEKMGYKFQLLMRVS